MSNLRLQQTEALTWHAVGRMTPGWTVNLAYGTRLSQLLKRELLESRSVCEKLNSQKPSNFQYPIPGELNIHKALLSKASDILTEDYLRQLHGVGCINTTSREPRGISFGINPTCLSIFLTNIHSFIATLYISVIYPFHDCHV